MIFFDGWEPVLRILVIGPLAFITLVVVLRSSGKRTLSKMNAFDFVVTIALGSLFATVIINQEVTLAEGAASFAVLVVAQFAITFISVRSDRFERFLKAEPTLLYRNGEMLSESLRRVRVTEREVETIARRRGLPNLDTVSAVILEADGSFSVIESGDDIELYPDDRSEP
ncbi:MAG: YetF domain-containing protein [Acidimicrobiia bacterium]